jgi:heat shock protein HslJ
MRKAAFLAFLIGATAILAACGAASSSGLTDKDWQLTAITEKVPAFQGVIPAEDQSKYTITFNTDLTFASNADCNQVGGTYKTPGDSRISIDVTISTMAFCPEDSFSALYIHALGRAKTYEIVNETLTITLDDEGTLVFVVSAPTPTASEGAAATATPKPTKEPTPKPTKEPTPKPTAKPSSKPTGSPAPSSGPVAPTGLIGVTWQLTTLTTTEPVFQGQVPEDQQKNYTIIFAEDGSFSGLADCNSVTGTYATADPTAASGDLTVVPGAMTSAACPPGSLADLYLLGLSSAASYAVADGQLTITNADEGTLVFVPGAE